MNNIKKRGQSAIEFIITYGWAIMAAMLVIGALTYFGITNPSTSLPDKCIFSNAFECKDYQITSTTLNLKVINTMGQTIYADSSGNISAKLTETDYPCTVNYGPDGSASLEPEMDMEVICTNPPGSPFNTRDKAKIKVTLTYAKTPSGGYDQVSLGEVYATVQ